jgi:hypothetical protein
MNQAGSLQTLRHQQISTDIIRAEGETVAWPDKGKVDRDDQLAARGLIYSDPRQVSGLLSKILT